MSFRFALVIVGSDNSSRAIFDKLPRKEIHGQVPQVTPYSRHALNQLEAASRKGGEGPPQANNSKCYYLSCLQPLVRAFAHGAMGHRIDPSWGGHIELFLVAAMLHNWCNKGHGMCYPVCGMVHIKEPLLLIGKSSPCGGSRFPFSLSEWSLTICLTPYNRK